MCFVITSLPERSTLMLVGGSKYCIPWQTQKSGIAFFFFLIFKGIRQSEKMAKLLD